jgi:hypothetical protein
LFIKILDPDRFAIRKIAESGSALNQCGFGNLGGMDCVIAHSNQAIKRNGKSVRLSRDELVHGFILVYSTRRKASLSTLRYRMVSVRRYCMFLGLPDPDPVVLCTLYRSGYGSFYNQAKIVIATVL